MTLTHSSVVTEADLLAYVDGRLERERRAEIEDHLARCPQDAGRIAADLALQEGLRLLFGRPACPPIPLRRARRTAWLGTAWLARVAMAAGLAVGGFVAGLAVGGFAAGLAVGGFAAGPAMGGFAARLEAAPQIIAPAIVAPGAAVRP